MNFLRPIKGDRKRIKNVYFATTDIEVYEWTNFLCIGFYDGHSKKYKWFSSLAKYTEWVFEYCAMNEIKNIFAHFGGKFDFNFLLREFCFNEKYIVEDIIPRGSGLLCFTLRQSNPDFVDVDGKDFAITFRDSSALLPNALGSLTKAFKVKTQKGDMCFDFTKEIWENKNYIKKLFNSDKIKEIFYDGKRIKKFKAGLDKNKITYTKFATNTTYRHYNRNDLLMYLEDDCVSLWQVLSVFYSWDLVEKAGACFTTASQAVKIWQTFIKEPISSLGRSMDAFCREGYYGGRTEVFSPIFDSTYDIKNNPQGFDKEQLAILKKQAGKDLHYLDINSLYPTVMRDNDFPTKCLGWIFGEHYDPNALGIWDCEVDVPKSIHFPPLPTKHVFKDKTEKLIFPTGKFRGVWCTPELEYAKTLGVKITKIHKGVHFQNGGKIFKDFIINLYDRRLKAKKVGDTVNDLLTKLIMNSCYGRLGLNIERENLVIDTGQAGLKIHSRIVKNGKEVRFMKNDIELDNAFTNVAISFFVTAYARILMHRDCYSKCKPHELFYTDTDSIFSTKKFKTGTALGELKLEYNCKSACFLLPKTYVNEGIHGGDDGDKFDKKLTMKGFDKKKIQHFSYDDFISFMRGDAKRLKIIQAPKFATLRTALQKGEFVCMNFDPETNKKVDKKKMIMLKKKLKEIDNLEDLTAKEKSKEKTKIKARIRNLEKKEYNVSERSIRSKYEKRNLIKGGFQTTPIHLS